MKKNTYLNQKGSLMVEMCAVCICLITFFLFMGEMVLYIRDCIHVEQAAREGAREACLISSSPRFNEPLAMGRAKAEDCMVQYYGRGYGGNVNVTDTNGSFICEVQFQHQVFCMPAISKTVHGTAIYPNFEQ